MGDARPVVEPDELMELVYAATHIARVADHSELIGIIAYLYRLYALLYADGQTAAVAGEYEADALICRCAGDRGLFAHQTISVSPSSLKEQFPHIC